MLIATITVSESLECDGGSISVELPDGRPTWLVRVGSRRQYRTEYVTWEVHADEEEGEAGR